MFGIKKISLQRTNCLYKAYYVIDACLDESERISTITRDGRAWIFDLRMRWKSGPIHIWGDRGLTSIETKATIWSAYSYLFYENLQIANNPNRSDILHHKNVDKSVFMNMFLSFEDHLKSAKP